jgi:hypothetical protein
MGEDWGGVAEDRVKGRKLRWRSIAREASVSKSRTNVEIEIRRIGSRTSGGGSEDCVLARTED